MVVFRLFLSILSVAQLMVSLIGSTDGRTIVMLGPQSLGVEAGTQWNDASSDCNSRLVVNGVERKLKYCAYYNDMNSVEDNPPLAGIPMDCYTGCTWNTQRRSCTFASDTAVGNYRGTCNQPAVGTQLQCYLPDEQDCRTKLLAPPNEQGVPQTRETVRGASDSNQPTRLSVVFNPGAYFLQYGTAQDSCISPADCDPTIAPCNNAVGPCIKVINFTDTRPPIIELRQFCHTPYINGGEALGTEVCEPANNRAITIEGNSSYTDAGAYGDDLVDGFMHFVNDTCPLPSDTGPFPYPRVCGTVRSLEVCGYALKTCSIVFTSLSTRSLDVQRLGRQSIYYISVDRVGNVNFTSRAINIVDSSAPTIRINTSDPTQCNADHLGCNAERDNVDIDIEGGHRYLDAGAVATDGVQGRLFYELIGRSWGGSIGFIPLPNTSINQVMNTWNKTLRLHDFVVEYPGDYLTRLSGQTMHVSSVKYEAWDNSGNGQNRSASSQRTVVVKDTIGPVTTLLSMCYTKSRSPELAQCIAKNNGWVLYDSSNNFSIVHANQATLPKEPSTSRCTSADLTFFQSTSLSACQAACAANGNCAAIQWQAEMILIGGVDKYLEHHATAIDDVDGEITNRVVRTVRMLNLLPSPWSQNCDDYRGPGGQQPAPNRCNNDPGNPFWHESNYKAPAGTIWTIQYFAVDYSNNQGDPVSRNVSIIDPIAPILSLENGEDGVFSVEGGDPYYRPNASMSDNLDTNQLFQNLGRIRMDLDTCGGACEDAARVLVINQPRLGLPAFTRVTATFFGTDYDNNPAVPIQQTIVVKDSRPPIITVPQTTESHESGTAYYPDVAASDGLDGSYDFFPRYSSRIRSNVRVIIPTCNPATQFSSSQGPGTPVVCLTISNCSSQEYEETQPTLTSNRECRPLTTCGAGEQELVPPTITTDRICNTCAGGFQTTAEIINEQFTLRAVDEDSDGYCDQITYPQLLQAPGISAQAAGLIVTAIEPSNAGHFEWVTTDTWTVADLSTPGSAFFVRSGTSIRFIPSPNFNGLVGFRVAEYPPAGMVEGDVFVVPDIQIGTTVQFTVNTKNDRPVLSGGWDGWQTDEDVPTSVEVRKLICPDLELGGGTCYFSDQDEAAITNTTDMGIALLSADTSNGNWWYHCCEDATAAQERSFFRMIPDSVTDPDGDSALLLSGKCIIRFVPDRDYNTEDSRSGTLSGTGNPSISYRAWDMESSGIIGLSATGIDVSFCRLDKFLVSRKNLGAVPLGVDTFRSSVTVFNVNDRPQIYGNPAYDPDGIIETSSSVPYNVGGRPISLFDAAYSYPVFNPDRAPVTQLTVTYNAADTFIYFAPASIEVDRSRTGEIIFRPANNAISFDDSDLQEFVSGMLYAPTRAASNVTREVILTLRSSVASIDDSIDTTFLVVPQIANSPPELLVSSSSNPLNDQNPFQRVQVLDDNNRITAAQIIILDGVGAIDGAPADVAVTDNEPQYMLSGNFSGIRWQTILRGLLYTGTYPATILLSIFDGTSESIPLPLYFTRQNTYTPVRIETQPSSTDGLPVETGARVIQPFRQGDGPIVLLPSVSTDVSIVAAPNSIVEVSAEIVNAYDCPFEFLDVENGVSSGLELVVTSASSLSIRRSGSPSVSNADFISILRRIRYVNYASIPNAALRIINITIVDTNTSSTSFVSVSITRSNNAPAVYPLDGISNIKVVQDVPDVFNEGIPVDDLVSHSSPSAAEYKGGMYFMERCGDTGCQWNEAEELCRARSTSLCTQQQVIDYFPQSDHTGILAWISNESEEDAYEGYTVGPAQADLNGVLVESVTINGVSVDIPLLDNSTDEIPNRDRGSALVAQSHRDAKSPRFFPARKSDRAIGSHLGALCCIGAHISPRRARATIESTSTDTFIRGHVSIEQLSPGHAATIQLDITSQLRINTFGASHIPTSHTLTFQDAPATTTCRGDSQFGQFSLTFTTDSLDGHAVASYTSNNVTIFGTDSIVGRSISIRSTPIGSAITNPITSCGTVVVRDRTAEVVSTFPATSGSLINGSVTFRYEVDDLDADVTIESNLMDNSQVSRAWLFDSSPADRSTSTCEFFPVGFRGTMRIPTTGRSVQTVAGGHGLGRMLASGGVLHLKADLQQYSPGSDRCAVVLPGSVDLIRVPISMNNVKGSVTIGPTGVSHNLVTKERPGIATVTNIAIHSFPLVDRGHGFNPCNSNIIGPALISNALTAGALTSFGTTGVAGRSILITFTRGSGNAETVCANIPYPDDTVVAAAQFTGPSITGTITFQELASGDAGSVTIMMDLNGGIPGAYSLRVHSGSVPCSCSGAEQCAPSGEFVSDTAIFGINSSTPIQLDLSGGNVRSFYAIEGLGIVTGELVLGSTLQIVDSTGAVVSYAVVKPVSQRIAKATVYGILRNTSFAQCDELRRNGNTRACSDEAFAEMVVTQSNFYADPQIDLRLHGNVSISEWFISETPPKLVVDKDGRKVYDCSGARPFNPYNVDESECNDNSNSFVAKWTTAEKCSAGNLGSPSIIGGLECVPISAVQGTQWRCGSVDQGASGWHTRTDRFRQHDQTAISLFGKANVVGRALVMKQSVQGASTTLCAPIAPLESNTDTQTAVFDDSVISGRVTIHQTKKSVFSESVVEVDIDSTAPTLTLQLTPAGSYTTSNSQGTGWELTSPEDPNRPVEGSIGLAVASAVQVRMDHVRGGWHNLNVTNGFNSVSLSLTGAPQAITIEVQWEYFSASQQQNVNAIRRIQIETSCSSTMPLNVGDTFGRLQIAATPCRDWILSKSCAGNAQAFNPNNAEFQSALGNLSSRVGKVRVPGVSTFLESSLYSSQSVQTTDLYVVIPGSETVCAKLEPRSSSMIADVDENDAPGLALTGLEAEHGRFQVKLGRLAAWADLDASEVSRGRALLLGYGIGNKIRFIPEPGFQGSSTCGCADSQHTGEEAEEFRSCVPCTLDRTAGGMRMVAWDGSNDAPSGIFVDARYTGNTGSFSEREKFVNVEVIPASLNETAVAQVAFEIEYFVRDNAGNPSQRVNVTLTIADNIPPVLTLRGEATMVIEGGEYFQDPGATALDGQELDISASIVVSQIRRSADGGNNWAVVPEMDGCGRSSSTGTVISCEQNMGVMYELTYGVTDANGNSAVPVVRTVTLIDRAPPAVYPLVGSTYEVVGLEYVNSGGAFQSTTATPDCLETYEIYAASEIGKLGCFAAVDRVRGDATSSTLVTVLVARSNFSWSESNSSFGPARVEGNCIARDNLDNGEVDIDCPTNPLFVSGSNAFSVLSASRAIGTRFIFTYTTIDAAGNTGNSSRMVIVVDTVAPTLLHETSRDELDDDDVFELDYWARSDARGLVQGLRAYDEGSFPGSPRATRLSTGFAGDVCEGCVDIEIGGDEVNSVSPSRYYINYTIYDRVRPPNKRTYQREVRVKTCDESCPNSATTNGITITATYDLESAFDSIIDTYANHVSFRNQLISKLQQEKSGSLFELFGRPDTPQLYQEPETVPFAANITCSCKRLAITSEQRRRLKFEVTVDCEHAFLMYNTLQMLVPNITLAGGGAIRATTVGIPDASLVAPDSCSDLLKLVGYDGNELYTHLNINDPAVVQFSRATEPPQTTVLEDKDASSSIIIIIIVVVVSVVLCAGIAYYRIIYYKKRSKRVEMLTMMARDDIYAEGYAIPMAADKERRRKSMGVTSNPSFKKQAPQKKNSKKYSERGNPALPKKKTNYSEDGNPPLPSKGDGVVPRPRTESSTSTKSHRDTKWDFEHSDESFYDSGEASRDGFRTHNKENPPPPRPPVKKFEFEESAEDFYDSGDVVKHGFKTNSVEEPKPPPKAAVKPPTAPVKQFQFEESAEDFYDSGHVAKAGFKTNSVEEPAPAPPPKVAQIQFEESAEDFYDSGDVVKAGFMTNSTEKQPPKLPVKQIQFEESEEDFYDSGNAVKAGFKTDAVEEPKPTFQFEESAEDFYDSGTVAKAGFQTNNVSSSANTDAFLHGQITRSDAETLLRQAGLQNGMFLVRQRGDMCALSLCADGQFEHHVLKQEGASFTLNGAPLAELCPTLPEVVALLTKKRDAQLACVLGKPVSALENLL